MLQRLKSVLNRAKLIGGWAGAEPVSAICWLGRNMKIF